MSNSPKNLEYNRSYNSLSYGSASSSVSNHTNSPKPAYRPTIKPHVNAVSNSTHSSSNYYSNDITSSSQRYGSDSQNSNGNHVSSLTGIDLVRYQSQILIKNIISFKDFLLNLNLLLQLKNSVLIDSSNNTRNFNSTTNCYPIQILHQKSGKVTKPDQNPLQSTSRVSFNDHVDEIPIQSNSTMNRSSSTNCYLRKSLDDKVNSSPTPHRNAAFKSEIENIKTELLRANNENIVLKK